MREEVMTRLGDLAPHCTVEHLNGAPPVEAPAGGELYDILAATIRAHDPDGIPVPVMAPFATDAKSTRPPGRPDLRLLAPARGAVANDSWSASTAPTSGLASRRSAGACRSSTTWS